MRRIISVVVAMVLVVAFAPTGSAEPAVAAGFEGPESIHWDSGTEAWYASNFGGLVFGVPASEGFISRFTPDASAPEVFVDGLDQPFGVTTSGSTMYVADSPGVVVIDMDAAEVTRTIPVDAALNDVAVDPATGDVYASDTGDNTIYRIDVTDPAIVEEFVSGPELDGPNGLLVDGGELVVGTFGLGGGMGQLLAVDLTSKELRTIAEDVGNIDGVEKIGSDYLVTDYFRGRLVRVTPDGSTSTAAQVLPGAADHGIDPARSMVAVPHTLLNVVTFTEL